jgi:hypothetical protein
MSLLSEILKEVPLSTVLKEKIADLEAKNAALETEIAILKDDLRQAQAENKRLKDQIQSLTHSDLDEPLLIILTFLAKREGDVVTDSDLASALKMNTTRARYYAGQLEEKSYVSAEHHSGVISLYTLTQKGREYAVKNNLI